MSLLGKVVKAALTKPWEDEDDEPELEVGDGAPDDWEMRVPPDGSPGIVIWNPYQGLWFRFEEAVIQDSSASLHRMEQQTRGWTRLLPVIEED